MIARRPDITESTVKVHVKHMLKKMKLKSRVEAAVWVHQSESSKASPSETPGVVNLTSGSVNAGRSHWRRRAALFILHHHRQAPAVRGARFTVPHRHNDAPAIGAAGIYRRRQAEGPVSPCQCSALIPCRLWICSFNCTVSPDCRSAAWPDRPSDFALTIPTTGRLSRSGLSKRLPRSELLIATSSAASCCLRYAKAVV